MKTGNRIVVIKNKDEPSIGVFYDVGDIGTIIDIDDDGSLDVKFDKGSLNSSDSWWISPESVKIIKGEKKNVK